MTQERAMIIMRQHGKCAIALDNEGTIGLFDTCCRLYDIVQWNDGYIIERDGNKMPLFAWLGY